MKSHTEFFKRAATSVIFILIVQVVLGISNVWFSLPISVAVGHNLIAACLMLSLIALTYGLRRKI